jgi:hypothetical protein
MLMTLVTATHYRVVATSALIAGSSTSRKQHLNLRESTACCDEAAADLERFY